MESKLTDPMGRATTARFPEFVTGKLVWGLFAVVFPIAAQSGESGPPAAKMVFVDDKPPLLVERVKNAAEKKIVFTANGVAVWNSGGVDGRGRFCIVSGADSKDCISGVKITNAKGASSDDSMEIGAGRVIQVSIEIPAEKLHFPGYIGLVTQKSPGAPTPTSFRAIKEKPRVALTDAGWYPFLAGLIFATLLCGWATYKLANERLLKTRLGAANWDFSKSWATNITVASAAASITVALAVMPEQLQHMEKSHYLIINVFLTILGGLGPAFFAVTRTSTAGDKPTNDTQYQGYVWGFLVAAWFTVFATIAQLTTFGILIDELRVASPQLMPEFFVRTFEFFIFLIAAGVLKFCIRTLCLIPRGQAQRTGQSPATDDKAKMTDKSSPPSFAHL